MWRVGWFGQALLSAIGLAVLLELWWEEGAWRLRDLRRRRRCRRNWRRRKLDAELR